VHTLVMTMEFLENWNMQLNFKVTAGNMWCFRFFCVYSLKFIFVICIKKFITVVFVLWAILL
jgi:hypothetical protein